MLHPKPTGKNARHWKSTYRQVRQFVRKFFGQVAGSFRSGSTRLRMRRRTLLSTLFLGGLSWTLPGCNSNVEEKSEEITEEPDAMRSEPVLPEPMSIPNPLRVDRDRLMGHLTQFSQPRFTDAERDRARIYLEEVLRDRGWVLQQEGFTIPRNDATDLNGVNLILDLPGTDPTLAPLLVGAHYDSVRNSPGADDNASGAIALLEIALLLLDRPQELPRSLRLVWFDLEEFGLLGSFYHVAQLDKLPEAQRPYGAIVLEMLGYACSEPGCQQVPQGLAIALPDRGTFLGVVGDAGSPELLAPFKRFAEETPDTRDRLGHPPMETLAVPTRLAIAPNLLRSDHVPFWTAGIGALMVTDTANFRNPHYHRTSDRPETLDPDFFARSTQAVLDATIALLADPNLTNAPEPRA